MNNGQSGFLLVYKPAGITTYDIIRIVKKRTGQRKIGHTGTLDPFAEGIVILLLGQMTRMFDYFSTLEKITGLSQNSEKKQTRWMLPVQ